MNSGAVKVFYDIFCPGFSLNGELMMDFMGQEIAFKGIDSSSSFVPVFLLGPGQQAKVNFGQVSEHAGLENI